MKKIFTLLAALLVAFAVTNKAYADDFNADDYFENLDFESCTWNSSGWVEDHPGWELSWDNFETNYPRELDGWESALVTGNYRLGVWTAGSKSVVSEDFIYQCSSSPVPAGIYLVTVVAHADGTDNFYFYAGDEEVAITNQGSGNWSVAEVYELTVEMNGSEYLEIGLGISTCDLDDQVNLYADNFTVTLVSSADEDEDDCQYEALREKLVDQYSVLDEWAESVDEDDLTEAIINAYMYLVETIETQLFYMSATYEDGEWDTAFEDDCIDAVAEIIAMILAFLEDPAQWAEDNGFAIDDSDVETDGEFVFTPANWSDVECISSITIAAEDGIAITWWNEIETICVYDENFEVIATGVDDVEYEALEDGWYDVAITVPFDTTIAEAGTYYIEILEDTFATGESNMYMTYNKYICLTINVVETESINGVKALTISDAYYTIGGVRMTTPVKGLNIVNGKKVILK